MKILANDGISPSGKEALEKAGFTVVTDNVPQDDLENAINNEGYVGLLVRSATKVRQPLIDACPGLKLIGRGGVGMDNIDVDYARSKGLEVINTPASSSLSVAELVMAQAFAFSRFLHKSYAEMPVKGADEFKALKKAYAKGSELRGKTLGIIGMGRIGTALATYALGCGMKVIFHTRNCDNLDVKLHIVGHGEVVVNLKNSSKEEVVANADFLSLNVPAQADGSAVIGAAELKTMKSNAVIINAARGGSVDEAVLIEALDNNVIKGAILDVFVNEPTPNPALLNHAKIATTPHIGAATAEAQDRIGLELAEKICSYFQVEV